MVIFYVSGIAVTYVLALKFKFNVEYKLLDYFVTSFLVMTRNIMFPTCGGTEIYDFEGGIVAMQTSSCYVSGGAVTDVLALKLVFNVEYKTKPILPFCVRMA